jgi:CRISPR-associated endonuclease/helicase Cas3
MNLIVIDASAKKAAIRSRRVLSKWFAQLGADTYAGRLSEEGLRDLIAELKGVASKNTSVAIHRVKTRDRMDLVTVVGNKDSFDEEGRWAFRTKMTFRPEIIAPQFQVQELCLKLAGLVHDFGKCNLQFQAKLKANGITGERVRHEALSFFMFVHALQPHLKGTKDELVWLKAGADDPARLFSGLVTETGDINLNPKVLAAIRELSDDGNGGAKTLGNYLETVLYKETLRKSWPVFHTVAWLVLTHHRLPGFQREQASEQRQPASFVDHVFSSRPFNADNLTTQKGSLPWEDEQWLSAFRSTATQLHQLLSGEAALQPQLSTLGPEIAHALRPALILGDQLASVMQEDVLKRREREGNLLANTCKGTAGDTLPTHLRNVGRRAAFVWNVVATPERWFRSLAISDLPATSLFHASIPNDSPFYWQKRAADAVSAITHVEARPFFAVLMAAPGTGKTVAGPRILAEAAGGAARWTLALGLKSLTLQSGAAYQDKLCIPASDLATMVGDRATVALFQAERTATEEESTRQRGSNSLDIEDNFEFYEDFSREFGRWRQALEPPERITSDSRIFTDKLSRFIDAPVVACTVDHLVRVAELVRSGEARTFLRVVNSDLILDEIDNYSAEDLVTLGKLVYMYGLFGRRVVLMSGTVSPQIVFALQKAWYRGLRAYRARTQTSTPSITLLAGNLGEPCLVDETEYDRFSTVYEQFADEFAGALEAQPRKVFATRVVVQLDTVFEDLFQACRDMHGMSSVLDTNTGSRFSIGFVRFNATRGAREFAKYLHARREEAESPLVKIVCYHSRMPRFFRCAIEAQLDKGLQRHNTEIPNLPAFCEALEEANGRDVMVVVATTSIQETGRDHDYDWAIVEPSSEQSAIQAAGRVRRHRPRQETGPNFGVLSTTLRALQGKTTAPYGYTGVQDFKPFARSEDCLLARPVQQSPLSRALTACGISHEPAKTADVLLDSRHLLPVSSWERGLTPASAIRPVRQWEVGRLAALNCVRLYHVLEGAAGEQTSLEAYLASGLSSQGGLWLDRWHARQTRFRDDDGKRSLEIELVDETFDAFRFKTEEGADVQVPFVSDRVENPERALIRLDDRLPEMVDAMLKRYKWPRTALRLLLRGEAALPADAKDYLTKAAFTYHPLLGFGAP